MRYQTVWPNCPKCNAVMVEFSESFVCSKCKMSRPKAVNFYRDDATDEILTFCTVCAATLPVCPGDTFTYIDKAGDWDECGGCGAQNIPTSYHDGPDEPETWACPDCGQVVPFGDPCWTCLDQREEDYILARESLAE